MCITRTHQAPRTITPDANRRRSVDNLARIGEGARIHTGGPIDPHIASARHILKQSIEDIRRSLDGLSADALNWKPAGDDTNSMSVLTFHVWSSTRSWLSIALGAPLPERDRDAEFQTTTSNPDELRAWFEDIAQQCDALLDTTATIDWSAMRKTHARPSPDAPQEVPAAWALLHAIEHLREHEGQLSLTRQL